MLPLVSTWAAGTIADYLPRHAPLLEARLAQHLPAALAFLRSKCGEVLPSQDMNLTQSFLALLSALLHPDNGVRTPTTAAAEPRTAAQKARERWAKLHGADAAADAGTDTNAADEEEAKGGDAATATTSPAAEAPTARTDAAGVTARMEEEELDAEIAASAAAGEDAATARTSTIGAAPKRGRGRKTQHLLEGEKLSKLVDAAYVFAFVWSLGANLSDASRAKFNAFAHELLTDLIPPELKSVVLSTPQAAPSGAATVAGAGSASAIVASTSAPTQSVGPADLYGYFVDVPSVSLKPWTAHMAPFTYDPAAPYFALLVPTVDTTRFASLLRTLLSSGRHVLFSGETGVGKSVIAADVLNKLSATPEGGGESPFSTTTINFSAQTQSANLQEAFEANLQRLRKNLLGPPPGKRMCVFVDGKNLV